MSRLYGARPLWPGQGSSKGLLPINALSALWQATSKFRIARELLSKWHQRYAGDMFEVLVVTRYESHSPLPGACRNPGIGCPHRPPRIEALGRNLSPVPTGGFVRKKRRVELYEVRQKRTPFPSPVVPDWPKRQFGQSHGADHQMITRRDAERFPVEGMRRFEQN